MDPITVLRGGPPGLPPPRAAHDALAAFLSGLHRPAVFAHRGACREAPENSLAALRRAADIGADGAVFDVQRCATGELVVFHDATLGRCTGRPGFVSGTTFADLRRLVLDRVDPRGRSPGEPVPTLAEWLEVAPPGLFLNLEVKAERLAEAGSATECALALRQADRERTAVVSSFHPAALLTAARAVPGLARAMLVENTPGWRAYLAAGLAARPAAVHPEDSLVTVARVAAWHRLGLAVAVWTVDRPDDMRRCLDAGADALITNRPDLARPLAEHCRR